MMRARHRLYLADNLWLTGHEELYGKCYVSPTALGIGLAGSLLGELVLWNRLDCTPGGQLHVLDPTAVHDDHLATQVLHRILKEVSRPRDDRATHVSAWLNSLGPFANTWVTKRLTETNVVEPVEYTRRFRKSETRHVVIDVNGGRVPASNLKGRLARREPIREEHLAFAGFALATGLEKQLLRDTSEPDRRYLGSQLAGLRYSLRCLIAETDSAIGNAAFTHRG